MEHAVRWEFGRRRLEWHGASRVRLMGVVNVTPDSFFDGGQFSSHEAAVAHGLSLVEAGHAKPIYRLDAGLRYAWAERFALQLGAARIEGAEQGYQGDATLTVGW